MHFKRAVLTGLVVFFLLCTTVSAFEYQYEEIWVHQGIYELSKDDRTSAEKYTLKLHEITSADTGYSATVLIYEDGEFKESFSADSKLNNEYLYGENLKIRTLDLEESKISLEMYIHEYELVWIPGDTIVLDIGEDYDLDDINIEAVDIIDDTATIKVTKSEQAQTDDYVTGNHHRYYDEILIRVTYVDKADHTVTILPYQPGRPVLEVEIKDLNEIYSSNEEPVFNIIIKNKGTIPARGISITANTVNANIDPSVLEIPMLDISDQYTMPVNLTLSETPTGQDIEISVFTEGYDYRGNKYQNSTASNSFVEPYISISRNYDTTQLQDETEDPEIIFTLIVHNNASIGYEVTVSDPLPPSFMPIDMSLTKWDLFVDSERSKILTYSIKPATVGTFSIDPATASWYSQGETYSVSSGETSTITVGGMLLEVEKDVVLSDVYIDEEVDVKIKIRNIGTRDVTASFTDVIPEGFEFINGQNNWEGEIIVGDEEQFNYTMLAKEEAVYDLKPTIVSAKDEKGQREMFESDAKRVYVYSLGPVNEIKEISEKVDQKTNYQPLSRNENIVFMLSSFFTIFSVFSVISLVTYLYIRRPQTNKKKKEQ